MVKNRLCECSDASQPHSEMSYFSCNIVRVCDSSGKILQASTKRYKEGVISIVEEVSMVL